jgi:hypothetical protein
MIEELRAMHILTVTEAKLGLNAESLVTSEKARRREFFNAFEVDAGSSYSDTFLFDKEDYSVANLSIALNSMSSPMLVYKSLSIESDCDTFISWLILPGKAYHGEAKIICRQPVNLASQGITDMRFWIRKLRSTLSMSKDSLKAIEEDLLSKEPEKYEIPHSLITLNFLRDIIVPLYLRICLNALFSRVKKIKWFGIRMFRWLMNDFLKLSIVYPFRLLFSLLFGAAEIVIQLHHYISPMRASQAKETHGDVNGFYACRVAHKLFVEHFEEYLGNEYPTGQELIIVTDAELSLVPYVALVCLFFVFLNI